MENNFDNENIVNEISDEVTTEEPKKFDFKKELKEWVVAIVVAVVVAFVIRTYFFELVQVDGPSMESTMHTGDRLVVVKLGYEPEQGDIVVFRPDMHKNTPYIKRVVATEGQTVYIDFDSNGQNGIVYVDGKVYGEPYIKNPTNRNGDVDFGRKSRPLVVPEDCVFVMGDNRMQSHDGRSLDVSSIKETGDENDYYYTYSDFETGEVIEAPIYYGCVHEDDIMGKAVLRIWPFEKLGVLK